MLTRSTPSRTITTLHWTAADLARLADAPIPRAPVMERRDVVRIAPDLDVWDSWPLADAQGHPVAWRGGELWFALAAPAFDDPEDRHGAARIHHFHRIDGRFVHLGRTFPEGFTPGSREWSGSALVGHSGADGHTVTLYFTAAGERAEDPLTFQQRIFGCTARLTDGEDVFGPWSDPVEQVIPANIVYMSEHDGAGKPGAIKAFRDPAPWRESGGNGEYMLFTASSARHLDLYNGVIGCALRGDSDPEGGVFEKLLPLVDASGVNNELERPHIVAHQGRLYLFWSTQAKVFAPGIDAPTGLYGAVADDIAGPWRLLNGHGLVFANPESEPFQAYSWWVLPDLSVTGFVDYWGLGDAQAVSKPVGRAHFGGTFAPFLHLRLEGDRATLTDG